LSPPAPANLPAPVPAPALLSAPARSPAPALLLAVDLAPALIQSVHARSFTRKSCRRVFSNNLPHVPSCAFSGPRLRLQAGSAAQMALTLIMHRLCSSAKWSNLLLPFRFVPSTLAHAFATSSRHCFADHSSPVPCPLCSLPSRTTLHTSRTSLLIRSLFNS
jgi:hypothetical protein